MAGIDCPKTKHIITYPAPTGLYTLDSWACTSVSITRDFDSIIPADPQLRLMVEVTFIDYRGDFVTPDGVNIPQELEITYPAPTGLYTLDSWACTSVSITRDFDSIIQE
jgi:hypothetical protein